MKSETLSLAWYQSVQFCIPLFLHNFGVLNANLTNKILYLMSFTFKLAKQKMIFKITSFLFFGAHKYKISVLCLI